MTDNQEPAADPAQPAYVTSYSWTDAHGAEGTIDIHAAPAADPPVQARTPDGAPVPVIDGQGNPDWSVEQLRQTGLDTAAARNDLINVVHETFLALPDEQ